MKKQIKIRDKVYNSKKEALLHYKKILNSYHFGDSLNDYDFNDLIDLLWYSYLNFIANNDIEHCNDEPISIQTRLDFENTGIIDEIEIVDIKVSRVQFNTKCFEVFHNDGSSQYLSYLLIINQKSYNAESLFNSACRTAIQKDVYKVKKDYFDKNAESGLVKCQESGIPSDWNELVIDHRQPNTFSVIVDRFIELNNLDLKSISYKPSERNMVSFQDEKLALEFQNYHKTKANFRLVRKEFNQSRSSMAKQKRTNKDLSIP